MSNMWDTDGGFVLIAAKSIKLLFEVLRKNKTVLLSDTKFLIAAPRSRLLEKRVKLARVSLNALRCSIFLLFPEIAF